MARVLIVDDEMATVEMLSKALSLLGHEPVPAYDGEHALRILAEDRPDLVLLDLMMPDMDGYETLRRLRELDRGREVPVLVVTASPDADLEQKVEAAGGDGYLRKPVGLDTLAQAVDQQARAR
jgi:CheY-like chemotaxis protein